MPTRKPRATVSPATGSAVAIDRRTFLGLTAGLAAGAAASPAPWDLARELTRLSQDPSWLPSLPHGAVRQTASVSLSCPSAMGTMVLTVAGRPMLVRGNPDHPLSQGAITPPAQAEALALHDPARIRGPLARNASGVFEPVSWAQALELLAGNIRAAAGRVMAVGDSRAGALRELLAAFMERFGPQGHYCMPGEGATAQAAIARMGGLAQPGYDLDNASGLVLLGADAFESMPASPHLRKAWARRPGAYSAFFGPVRGATAALCREWRPLPAGQEATLAMGLAWHLADMGRVSGKAPDLADFIALARQRFGPEEVRRLTGLTPETLRGVAGEIAAGALPVPGSPCGEGLGQAPLVAGLALSVLTGRVNRPGGMYLTRTAWAGGPPAASRPGEAGDTAPHDADLPGRFKDMALGLSGSPDVLLLVESDPVALLPCTELATRAVGKCRFKAAFAARMTASARLCDLILPAPMPLERWDDAITPYGLAFSCYGLARPLARMLTDARHPGDVLLDVAVRLERPLGPSSFRQALRDKVALLEKEEGFVARGVDPWSVLKGQPRPAPEAELWRALLEGHLWVSTAHEPGGLSCGAKFLAQALTPETVDLGAPLTLAPQASLRARDGLSLQTVTTLAPQWLTALPAAPAAGAGGVPAPGDAPVLSVVRLNAATALKVRVHAGDRVRLKGTLGRMEAVVALDESVMDGHAAVLLGLGEGVGGNVRRIESSLAEEGSGVQAWAGCRVTVERV